MKGDFTRSTFDRKKHYHDVRMQQGRVQLDADWNEQLDIAAHRVETETSDTVGLCGAPMHTGGFHIVAAVNELSADEQAQQGNQDPPAPLTKGDFYISAGRYYVDGILCENEHIVTYTGQMDRPGTEPVTQSGTYLIYMDVWLRHITALDDPDIREVALGGPDTATRARSLWQVQAQKLKKTMMGINCLSDLKVWDEKIAPGTGRMAARAEEDDQSSNPCELAAQGGYRRLENQLYRVEVHTGGPRGTTTSGAQGAATFKWSRDNGAIVAGWEGQTLDDLTISTIGRDIVRGFASGQWIELIDDTKALSGLPGTLVRLLKVEGNILTIDPATATGPVDRAQFPLNPKIRRWDSDGQIKPTNLDWIDLEDGVQVQFTDGTYRTGDYWLIPARTATSIDRPAVGWPVDEITGKPERQLPHGVQHHYCRLAVAKHDGHKWTGISDCRNIFPPVTQLTSLLYVSGDGQEAMPANELDWPLQVRVVNGQHPVLGAKVKFSVTQGGGTLPVGKAIETAPVDGIAACKWTLGNEGKQQVKAELLDAAGDPISGQIIYFNADLSTAKEVAYVVPDCNAQYGERVPTVHSLMAASGTWPDIDKDGHSTVKDMLDALLCKLDASKIPFEVRQCSNSIFENKRQTVAEALLSLCNLELLAGCAVTIGSKERPGTYGSIHEALEKEKGDDICLCLLPGEHTIEKDLESKGKTSVKITGCGASVHMKEAQVNLAAQSVMLYGTKFYFEDERSSILLSGYDVVAEHCEFHIEARNKESAPLVTVAPLADSATTVNMRWESNKMEAHWVEELPKKASEFLMPVADIEFSAAARDRLTKITDLNPYKDKKAFESAVEKIAVDIEKTTVAARTEWFDRRSTRRINKLPVKQKSAIEGLYKVLRSDSFTPQLKALLRQNLADAFRSFYVFYYTDAIAVTKGVGGWLNDNTINGYVSLLYSKENSSYLRWVTGQSEEEIKKIHSNKSTWLKNMHDKDFYRPQSASLNLRGNDLYAVRSNAPFLMKIIESVLNKGEGNLEDLDLAYKSLTVTDNIFHSNNNSFVSETMVMQGNQFRGGTEAWRVVANIVGTIATLTGNVAPVLSRQAIIDCLLRVDPLEAANFLRIEN